MTISSWMKQNKVNKNATVWVNGLLMEKVDYNTKGFNFKKRDAILCCQGNNWKNFKRIFNQVFIDIFNLINYA